MMNHGSFGQYQRGNSCNQGRGQNSCAQPQPRGTASCNQPQSRPMPSCSQTRPMPPCNQPKPCPPPSCVQPQPRPTPPCNQPKPCPPPSCVQPQPRPVPPCNQPQGRPPRRPVGPSCPCSEMNQEQLLHWISLTKFACVDSALYLDTHPNDARALSDYNCYAQQLRALKDMYEKDFGPISNFGNSVSRDSWKWNTQPFPWHQKFMREE